MDSDDSGKIVLGCFNLFNVDESFMGFEKTDYDSFTVKNTRSKIFEKLVKSTISIENLPDYIKSYLENSGLSSIVDDISKSTKLNIKDIKTQINNKEKEYSKSEKNDEEYEKTIKILKAMVALIDKSFNMKWFKESEKFDIIDTLDYVLKTKDLTNYFTEYFDIDPKICRFVVANGHINRNLLNNSVNELYRETKIGENSSTEDKEIELLGL